MITFSGSLLLTVVDTVRGNDVFVTGCETDELSSVGFICEYNQKYLVMHTRQVEGEMMIIKYFKEW